MCNLLKTTEIQVFFDHKDAMSNASVIAAAKMVGATGFHLEFNSSQDGDCHIVFDNPKLKYQVTNRETFSSLNSTVRSGDWVVLAGNTNSACGADCDNCTSSSADGVLDKGPISVATEYIESLAQKVNYVFDNPMGTDITFAHAFLDGFYLTSGHSADGVDGVMASVLPLVKAKLYELESYALHKNLNSVDQFTDKHKQASTINYEGDRVIVDLDKKKIYLNSEK